MLSDMDAERLRLTNGIMQEARQYTMLEARQLYASSRAAADEQIQTDLLDAILAEMTATREFTDLLANNLVIAINNNLEFQTENQRLLGIIIDLLSGSEEV